MTTSEAQDETFVSLDTSDPMVATPTAAVPPNDGAIEASQDDVAIEALLDKIHFG